MEFFLNIAEDLFVYVLLLWVFIIYKRMYRKHAVTQAEYKRIMIACAVVLVLITLDLIRRIIWPPK